VLRPSSEVGPRPSHRSPGGLRGARFLSGIVEVTLSAHERRLLWAARSLTVGGVFLAAAAAAHFLAAPHMGQIVGQIHEPRVRAFVGPILSFTFLLNAFLLVPLSFSTFWCAAGLRRGERWAWWVGLVNALTVLALPCLIVSTMGLRYFRGAPLFVVGTAAVAIAGLLMMLPLVTVGRSLLQPDRPTRETSPPR
jgi:hypothetical protein